eukprot:Opistho-1_new@44151
MPLARLGLCVHPRAVFGVRPSQKARRVLARAHVAYHRLAAVGVARAAVQVTLVVVRKVQVEQRVVRRHAHGEVVPVRRLHALHAVRLERAVLEDPLGRPLLVGLGEVRDVGEAVDHELCRAAVREIDAEARVHVGVGREGRAAVVDARGASVGGDVVGELILVVVLVAKELCEDGRFVAIDNDIVVVGPVVHARTAARGNVPDDVDELALVLGGLKRVDEPLQLARRVRLVDQDPPVLVVAVVHVERHNAEALFDERRVKPAALDGWNGVGREPPGPDSRKRVHQPVVRVRARDVRRGKAVDGAALVVADGREDARVGKIARENVA